MRSLAFILLFLSMTATAQKLETNAPDLVYPILEEFISANYQNDQPSLETLFKLESIMIKNIPLQVDSIFIRKVYGLHYQEGSRHRIELDSSLLAYPKAFNRTLKHELGHVFGLKHINTRGLETDHPLKYEIMSSEHNHIYSNLKYADPEIWARINNNYYKDLKSLSK